MGQVVQLISATYKRNTDKQQIVAVLEVLKYICLAAEKGEPSGGHCRVPVSHVFETWSSEQIGELYLGFCKPGLPPKKIFFVVAYNAYHL